MNILLTILVGITGGLMGIKLKIPAGAMIGAMISVAAFNIITSKGFIPLSWKYGAQIIIGIYIGLSFNKNVLYELKSMFIPVIIMVAGLFISSIILGLFIAKVTNTDLLTAMLGASPGGLTEMTLIADAYGAEISKVVLMHLMRLTAVVTLLPMIIKKLIPYLKF